MQLVRKIGAAVMSVSVLVSGALFHHPKQRASSGSKCYVRATLRTTGVEQEFWSPMSFNSTASTALFELKDGDHLAVQGSLKLYLYQNKIERTVFVDHALPLRAKRRRDAKPPGSEPGAAPAAAFR
ncbi:single-stranded DNA-binding protein [Bradyrhizobium diazoefficiens]|nr:single-stranded DNA-binding protein [Bradyrhizobium diazoefficiens]MBR0849300.1 single-stranded DNA-binding protein [Bradyrhizobium diazoefficiens]